MVSRKRLCRRNRFDTVEVLPNADGLNDKFVIFGIDDNCSEKLSLLIFNRWGEIVYET